MQGTLGLLVRGRIMRSDRVRQAKTGACLVPFVPVSQHGFGCFGGDLFGGSLGELGRLDPVGESV